MKNKMFGKYFASIMMCALAWAVVGCSEPSTAGGTVDGNSVADFSADEKLILEHQVDSVKNFVDGIPADIDDYERDTTRFWFEIRFSGERENYFYYEWNNPLSNCFINIYRSEYGVLNAEYNEAAILWTFFLTADGSGVTSHLKMEYFAVSESRCEKEISDFANACEKDGGTLYRHIGTCKDIELHLTCSTFIGHLTESADSILDKAAEKMKNKCMEGK
jgi:hypothetical protein